MSDKYDYWLHHLPGVGERTIRKLLAVFSKPEEIYERLISPGAGNAEWQKEFEVILTGKQKEALAACTKSWSLEEEYEKLAEMGIQFLTFQDLMYPQRLKEIPDPPFGLYVRGNLPKENVLSVAVIGARECSEYGRFVGQELGKTLGEKGVQVISGMARGIDGISQAAALDAGGISFGVLGCGVDICYPSQNKRLYERLLTQGGILSPYIPGTMPKAPLFPPRNRIVSGLADALIVVEARQKSGTLITVDMALEQGREVYVVPGRLTDRLSDGCNRLIKQGAGILLSPEDFLTEMSDNFPDKFVLCSENSSGKTNYEPFSMSKEERIIYDSLDLTPKAVNQICIDSQTKLSYLQVQQILIRFCLIGAAKQPVPGFYAAVHPPQK